MKSNHIVKGDGIVVIAGAAKGKRGKVIAVLRGKDRAIVEGVCMIKRHIRKSQQHPNGAIVEREGSIHISNLMKSDAFDARVARKSNRTKST